jgi:hypothetical protein
MNMKTHHHHMKYLKMQDGCNTKTMSIISTLDENGWKVKTLMSIG